MPPELSSKLHMQEHGINPNVIIETPYEKAEDKVLPMAEIKRRNTLVVLQSCSPVVP